MQIITRMTHDEALEKTQAIKGSFVNIRRTLIEIEDREGYIALGYRSMRAYMLTEFDPSQSQLYRELQAGRIEREISPIGEIGVMPESHLRELAVLTTPEERRTAAHIATDLNMMVNPNGKPTAAMFRAGAETVEEMVLTAGHVTIDDAQVNVATASALNKLSETLHRQKQYIVEGIQNQVKRAKRLIPLRAACPQRVTLAGDTVTIIAVLTPDEVEVFQKAQARGSQWLVTLSNEAQS